MKNVVIVHGCTDDEDDKTYLGHWFPWIKKELNKKGVPTEMPLMPEPWNPNYEEWRKVFEKSEINEETILIGHSCGSSFVVRWLGETKMKIKKLILVAPWVLTDSNFSQGENEMYTFNIDSNIKDRIKEMVIFTSDNEEEDGKRSVDIFYNVLGGKIIELKGKGHFIFKYMRTEEFPELLEVVLK